MYTVYIYIIYIYIYIVCVIYQIGGPYWENIVQLSVAYTDRGQRLHFLSINRLCLVHNLLIFLCLNFQVFCRF